MPDSRQHQCNEACGVTCLALDKKSALISQNKLYCEKKGLRQGETLHQPRGVAITVSMRTALSPGQVSNNHGQLFRHFLATIFAIVLSYSMAFCPLPFGFLYLIKVFFSLCSLLFFLHWNSVKRMLTHCLYLYRYRYKKKLHFLCW